VGTKSFGFDYAIRSEKQHRLVASARTVQVFYDYEAKRSTPCPPEFRESLERFEGRALTREVRS